MRPLSNLIAPRGAGALVVVGAIACVALSFIVYWPRLGDYFVYDDFFLLRAVRNHGFAEVMRRAFTFPEASEFDEVTFFWRPSIDLYVYLMRPFGLHSQPYHAVNVLLHGVVGALAVVFLRRFAGSAAIGVASGLLFIVAPTYEFAVTWVAQVSELLGAALILLALISYHAYLTRERPSQLHVAAAVGVTIAALLTKESTAILVALLPAMTLTVAPSERRRTWREVTVSLVPIVVLGTSFAIAMTVQDNLRPGESAHSVGLHMARNLWRYLEWMVYPYQPGDHIVAREIAAALFLATGVGAVALRQRVLSFLFVWTIAALLPFTGFDEWIELRYSYLATLPFIAFLVCAVVGVVERLPRPASVPATAVVATALVAALIVVPMRTRDFQAWFVREAQGYELMVNSVRYLCGGLPAESHVYVVNAPYRDLWGIHTPAALNLYYDRVYASPVDELPELAVFIDDKCVVEYDPASGAYRRIDYLWACAEGGLTGSGRPEAARGRGWGRRRGDARRRSVPAGRGTLRLLSRCPVAVA